jgi:hypothetical protein
MQGANVRESPGLRRSELPFLIGLQTPEVNPPATDLTLWGNGSLLIQVIVSPT